ncbi:MAG: hypothetical protein JNK67_27100 [Alphaproteobacteria bacterium]|nr:hypothetical protein [Alphaproteobacteria bacterium]
MTMPIVAPALFNAQVLAADDSDPHVPPGNYIRINADPGLGLPVAPFFISRVVAREGKGVKFRGDALFVDSSRRIVTPPFELRADNPVTAYIPLRPGESCIWARVRADALGGGLPAQPPAAPVRKALDTRSRLRAARLDRTRRTADAGGTATANLGMVAEAFAATIRGPASLGRRGIRPYAFSGPGIVEIRLTGSASVTGMEWLESRDLPAFDFMTWSLLTLPHLGGARYVSIENAIALAELRVLDQAPKRRPLQETLGMVAPEFAPAATPAYEALRVNALAAPLAADLDSLIADTSVEPLQQIVSDELRDGTRAIGTATQRRIDRVLQGQLDPGCAALLGYKARDREFTAVEDTLVFYWVSGFFRDFPSPVLGSSAFDVLMAALPPGNRFASAKDLLATLRNFAEPLPGVTLSQGRGDPLQELSDYVGLGTLCVADRSAPLLPPQAPRIDSARHVGWMPVTPPDARREVELAVGGVLAGGLLAAEKQTPAASGTAASMNAANAAGAHLPIVLGMSATNSAIAPPPEPGTGFLFDRGAGAEPIRYGVAQEDRFGRWSPWTSVVNDPGPRPRPPRPVLRATYAQPADPRRQGGTVRIQVDVPPVETLAPGSFLLRELRLTGKYAPTGGTIEHVVAVPSAPAPIDFTFTGPVLAAASTRKLRMSAVWRDTNGTDSIPSEPQTIRMHDPRPPRQLAPPPDELSYSGRPDVTGLATVEYEWAPLAGQANFAVYYTDENRLRAHLEAIGRTTILDGADDAPARAARYRENAALFGAHLFERLQGVVQDAATGKKLFRHAVSGSLRVLNFYRIAAEAQTGARVDLATLPLLVYAVPNADPPARPTITVRPGDMLTNADTYAAVIEIALTVGATAAATWRLRRSSLGATDALRMPIVASGAMPATGPDGRQRVAFSDTGPVVISTGALLQPWVRYHWVAEVQGEAAPGSAAAGRAVEGLWSQSSDPASLVLVPPQPPEPPTALTLETTPVGDGTFSDVVVRFSHPRVLSGGVVGSYRARVERVTPAVLDGDGRVLVPDSTSLIAETEIGGAGPFKISGVDAAAVARAGMTYRVAVIDPLGRASVPAEATLV